jgi:hypothetical protein
MPLNRIAIFSGLSAKQRQARTKFTACTRTCREKAPAKGKYGPCLRSCLNPKKRSSKKSSRR